MDIEGRVLVYLTETYQLTNEVCIRSYTKLVAPFANTAPTSFYATTWTHNGNWGSGPRAPDGEIPTQFNL